MELVTFGPMLWCIRRQSCGKRYLLWTIAFGMLVIVSIAGFFVHGFIMSESLNNVLWYGMYLLLCLMISSYVIAVKYDVDGEKGIAVFFKLNIALSVIVTFLLDIMTYVLPGYSFLLFSAYCLGNLVYCIVKLFQQIKIKSVFKWYLASIFILIVGSVLQSIKSIQFTVIWEFNYNAVYHFMTLLFMVIQFCGVRLIEKEKYGYRK